MTYSQAYNLIIEAYFKDEIKPLSQEFCFCGTLCNNSSEWFNMEILEKDRHNDFGAYTGNNYRNMELALFAGLRNAGVKNYDDVSHPNFEEGLFNGMSAALEVLRQIHIERGENVDDVPVFTKRQLA